MKNNDFFVERDYENTVKLNSVLDQSLPSFCREFFVGIQNRTSVLTRLNYAYDLRLFFNYLVTLDKFSGIKVKDFDISKLNKVTSFDVESFLSYISTYADTKNKKLTKNGEKGKARKLAAVRALLKYFFRKGKLTSNVASNVDTPKLHEKEILRLQDDEINDLLDIVESGKGLTTHQKAFHDKTVLRDTAIVTLLLGTGIRISECVGLNLEDISFRENSFIVTRKGGNRVQLYFSEEVAQALMQYIDQRLSDKSIPKTQHALFLSKTNERLSVRSVQLLVKKYSKIATPLKHITPHKLRSTYGTQLYHETGDIYLVADVLGHKDVNTTKRHYAAISDDIRRSAATKVTLHKKSRDDEDTEK